MADLVCPECGHDRFTADHSAVVRRTYSFTESRYLCQESEDVVDVDRDVDAFVCDDCGDSVTEDDLVTEEEYNDAE